MNCLLCGLPTGAPKDSYGFTMPGKVGKGQPKPFIRVHKSCLRGQGATRAERWAVVCRKYAESKAAAPAAV